MNHNINALTFFKKNKCLPHLYNDVTIALVHCCDRNDGRMNVLPSIVPLNPTEQAKAELQISSHSQN